jgi:hypothetical protein
MKNACSPSDELEKIINSRFNSTENNLQENFAIMLWKK